MNIVFIGVSEPFNVHLIRRLQKHWTIGTMLRIVDSHGPDYTRARLKELRRTPLRTLVRFTERRLFYRPLMRHIERQQSRQLFGSSAPPALDNCKCLDVRSIDINSPATVQLLRSLAPDVLLVSAAPLLKSAVYSTARIGAINVHHGIAPAYRGESTLFWAMYFADFEKLGVTIHYIDDGIDTGPVLAQGFPAIAGRESEAALSTKSSTIAAELLSEFFAAAGRRRPQGQSLPGPSRLFRSRDRRIWHDARLWFRRHVLRRPLPARQCSKTVYF